MNIRKTLSLVLIIAIAAVGLTLTGCDQKSDHPAGEHPTKDAEHPTEHPAAEETAEAVDEAAAVKEAVPAEHPTEHPTEHPK